MASSHRLVGRLLRSQFVAVSTEDGVAGLAGSQLLEGTLWGAAGHFSSRLLLRTKGARLGFEWVHLYPPQVKVVSDLSRRVVRGVRSMMELSV